MFIPKIIYAVFVISFGYFVILAAYYIILALIGSFEGMKRKFEGEDEDYLLFYLSALKMPVSIIVPARNEEEWIIDCLKALINLNYPEFEIIVVNDGSTDKTLEKLDKLLKLQHVEAVYVRHYKDGQIREILKSANYPNITVINKESGHKKAGSSNAGLNTAKYDYVCIVDADTVIERDALLKVMAQIGKEPDKIIGAGSYFGLANGLKIKDGMVVDYDFSYNPIVAYQNIEYIRSFIGNRIAWSRYNSMPNVAGGFGVWRRNVLYELGGYSTEFTCEDVEFTFRAHDYIVKNKEKGYRILMFPYCAGWTEGPSNVLSLILQRNRWQRVIDETIWHYRYMMCNPRYGAFAFLTLPYFLLYEVLGVFVEILSITFVAAGWIMGVLQKEVFFAYFFFMLLSQAFASLLCLLSFIEGRRLFKIRYIMYMAALIFVEFFWYRWLIGAARLMGTYDFLRRKKTYDMYIRPKRTEVAEKLL